ncbi:MAG: type transport system permease protein [Actinomycetota bacterium]|jgi:ABC-type transport system involved in multi-copper enzyme maturation permease subunit
MAVTLPIVAPGVRIAPRGNTYVNILKSEWTKIRSVRSTYWTLITAAVLTVGLSAIICAVFVAQYSHLKPSDLAEFDPAATSLTGGILAQFAIAVLGVMVMTGEYATGIIRTTLAAVPQRLNVLGAKIVVFTALTFGVTLVACFSAFFIGQAILSSKDMGVGITDTYVLRTVVGTAMYLTILGLLALGIGGLLRKTAGGICAMVGVLFVLPVVASFLPSSLQAIQRYLPSEAGTAIINSRPQANGNGIDVLGPWFGLGVFALYAIVALAGAGYLLDRRDA